VDLAVGKAGVGRRELDIDRAELDRSGRPPAKVPANQSMTRFLSWKIRSANKLKATADQVSGGASRLKPILDRIERSANELRELRVCGNPTQLAKLEPSILHALREIEAGNDRLGRLMSRLVHQGAEFEGLIGGAQRLMAALGEVAATLPAVAARLEASSAIMEKLSAAASSDEAALDGLFAQYTMEREREVHREVLQRFGLVSKSVAHQPEREDTDNGVLLF
jgi:hypothetical protein